MRPSLSKRQRCITRHRTSLQNGLNCHHRRHRLFLKNSKQPLNRKHCRTGKSTRIAKKQVGTADTPLQCKLLVAQAREIGKPLGLDSAGDGFERLGIFDKSWLQNQRPAPKLPMQESPVIDKPAPQACPATTVARAPVPNPCTSAKPTTAAQTKWLRVWQRPGRCWQKSAKAW